MSGLRTRADAAAQVLVDDLDLPACADRDAHHLFAVLRLRDGEQVVACDGEGSWRLCAVSSERLEPLSPVEVDEPDRDAVSVWLPPVKGDRAEWAVAKLTELGVDEIGLLACERAVVRLDDEGVARVLERWRRVAREATCQSRRTRLPTVLGPRSVRDAVGLGAVRCDLDGALDAGEATSLLVGPEGGLARAEGAARDACVSLGPSVLRTETAAVVAGTLLTDRARRRASLEAQ